MSSIPVNGTTLYYQRRGHGPGVLFISGAPGAQFAQPRPEGWSAAPIDEQADDAAELLRALDLAPAVAYDLEPQPSTSLS